MIVRVWKGWFSVLYDVVDFEDVERLVSVDAGSSPVGRTVFVLVNLEDLA
jgi:hypothetical protein